MSFQSERATSSQRILIIQINKIKISVLNLFHDDKEKLNFFLVQIKLYIRRYKDEFREIENQILFASTYLKKNAFK